MFKIKVLVLTSTYPRWEGDSYRRFVYDLNRALVARGHQIVVLAPHCNGARTYEEAEGMKIYRFPYFFPMKYQMLCYGGGVLENYRRSLLAKLQVPFFLLFELLYTIKIIKKEKPELIHAHWVLPHGMIGCILKRIFGIPLVITVHGSDMHVARNSFLRFVVRKGLQWCDCCTTGSNSLRKSVLDIADINQKVSIVPMGVDTQKFKPVAQTGIKEDLGISGNMVLFVGRVVNQKGVGTLIEAMPKVLGKFPDSKLVVIGEGPDRDKFVALSRSLGLKEYVAFVGAKSHDDLPDYYSSCDVFAMPSFEEGLGIVLLEAMACKKPVVASAVGGIKDVIKDGKTGILVPKNDPASLSYAIIELLSNKDLKTSISENAHKYVVKKYSWNKTSAEFSRIFKECAGG